MTSIQVERIAAHPMGFGASEAALRDASKPVDVAQERERTLRDYVELSGVSVWQTDREHRFLAPSEGTLEIAHLGKTRWEVCGGDPASDMRWALHKEDLDAHRAFRNFCHLVRERSGEPRLLSVSGKPLFDSAGEFIGYRGVVREEKVGAAELDRAERLLCLLRDAVENIAEVFIICDTNGRVVLRNEATLKTYPNCAHLLRPGAPFADFLRAAVGHGYFPEAHAREHEWLLQHLAQRSEGASTSEFPLHDGGWLLLKEHRMRGGGFASVGMDISRLKATQTALLASEARLDRAQRIAGIGSWELDPKTGRGSWSQEMYRIRGQASESFEPTLDNLIRAVAPEDLSLAQEWFTQLSAGVEQRPIEVRMRRPDGEMRIVSLAGQAIRDHGGAISEIAGTLRDITQRRRIEEQLVQAQKMEAVGNLTGGLAHDFNNLLGIIIGNLDLLRETLAPQGDAAEMARDALDAAMRGADLTRRLLAFARRQPLQPKRADVNALIADITKLLARTLGEDVEIEFERAAGLWPVVVDPVQLGAAITNLANNARDAMPDGGRLIIATRNIHLDADYAALHLDATPGDYVVIEVTDTGTGIPPELQSRIFDPFFTTKESGRGTGLGLSMVFGFLRQSGGHVTIYSELGSGTTFRLHLPRGSASGAEPRDVATAPLRKGAGERILVVEDNAQLLAIVVKQLSELGYAVRAAEGPRAAMAILDGEAPIDLLLTDIVMPGGTNGVDLAQEALRRRPGLKVLLTSGFPETRLSGPGILWAGRRLLSKPYRKDELARLVGETLDDPAPGGMPAGS